MATTERLNGEPATDSQVRDLEQQVQELAECLLKRSARQEETNAVLRAEIGSLREIVLSFADKLENTAGYMSREAGLLRDLLR